MSLRRMALYCGVGGPVLYLGLIVLTGAMHPGFSHATHYISELGAHGSSTEALMRFGGFELTGFLYVCFAAGLWATLPKSWGATMVSLLIALEGIGRMGAGIFPCDAGCVRVTATQDLHRLFATIGFSSGVVAAIVFGILCLRVLPYRSLAGYSIATGLIALVSLLLMSSEGNPIGPAGLLEHVASAALSFWLVVLAIRLLREGRVT